jgi:hypothetical protein
VWGSNGDIVGRLFNSFGTPVGGDFLVNTTTSVGLQNDPHVAALADGRAVVTWTDESAGSGNFEIRAQVLNADGSPSGAEINVTEFPGLITTGGNQTQAKVTALPDGGWVVTWQDNDGPADNDVFIQIFNGDGTLRGSDRIRIDGPDNDTQPAVAPVTGGFVVLFTETVGPNTEMHMRRYDAAGTLIGTEVTLDTSGTLSDQVQAIGLPDGSFAAVYRNDGWSSGTIDISIGHWQADGTLISWAPANDKDPSVPGTTPDGNQSQPALTMLANGYLATSWTDDASGSVDYAVWDLNGPATFIASSPSPFLTPADQSTIEGIGSGLFALEARDTTPSPSGTEIKGLVQELVRTTVGDGTDETLTGDQIRDVMSGLGGSDRINGGTGNNRLDGGAGDDTVVFDFNLTDATIRYDSGGHIVIAGPNTTDVLSGFEHYEFADGTVTEAGSPLIDDLFYYIRNPDVWSAHVDADAHYNTFGFREGRDPDAYFSTAGYLGANQDVKAAGINPLQHYDQFGWHEGRDPGANFDTTLYLQNNPDVQAAGFDPLLHFLQYGQEEGRDVYEAIGPGAAINAQHGFDAEYYLLANPDVASAVPTGGDAFAFALQHFNQFGWHEGRDPNALFDTDGYLAAYGDVAAAGVNPLRHFDEFGWHEGRDPSVDFDTSSYLAANPDVAAAGVDPLIHYLTFGAYEGRSTFADGSFA